MPLFASFLLPHSLCTPLLTWGLPPPIIATLQCRKTVWPYAAITWRRYLGMEASAQYTEIANQRLARELNTEPQNEESRRRARRNAGKALEDARKKDAQKSEERRSEGL